MILPRAPLTIRMGRSTTRGVAACLMLTLTLLLTPCCDIFAALQAASPSPTETSSHVDHDHDHAPISSEHCAPWLDQAFVPTGVTTLAAVIHPGFELPIPISVFSSASLPDTKAKVVPHAGAPPPTRALYLLTSHLLL